MFTQNSNSVLFQPIYPNPNPQQPEQSTPMTPVQTPQQPEKTVIDVGTHIKSKIDQLTSQIWNDQATVRNSAHQALEAHLWFANCFIVPLIAYPIVTLIGHLMLALTSYESQAFYADKCSHNSQGKLKSRVNCEDLLTKIESNKKELEGYKSIQNYMIDLKKTYPTRVHQDPSPIKGRALPMPKKLELNAHEVTIIKNCIETIKPAALDVLSSSFKDASIKNPVYMC